MARDLMIRSSVEKFITFKVGKKEYRLNMKMKLYG